MSKNTFLNLACSSKLSTIMERVTPDSSLDIPITDIKSLEDEFGKEEVFRCLVVQLAHCRLCTKRDAGELPNE